MVGPKKQDFWPKVNMLKGNHCILRIRGATVRQRVGMILENKVVQKLKLEKNGFFLQKKSFEHIDSWAKILHFWTHHL